MKLKISNKRKFGKFTNYEVNILLNGQWVKEQIIGKLLNATLHTNTPYQNIGYSEKVLRVKNAAVNIYIKKKKKERVRISNVIFHLKEQ